MGRQSFTAPVGIIAHGMADIIIPTIGRGVFMYDGIHGTGGVLDSVSGRGLFVLPSDSVAGEAGGVLHTRDPMDIREATEPHTEQDTERVIGMEPIEADHQDQLHMAAGATFTAVRRTLTGIFKDSSSKTGRGPMWRRASATMSTQIGTVTSIGVRTTAIGRVGKAAGGHPPKGRAHRIEYKRDSPQRDKDLFRH